MLVSTENLKLPFLPLFKLFSTMVTVGDPRRAARIHSSGVFEPSSVLICDANKKDLLSIVLDLARSSSGALRDA